MNFEEETGMDIADNFNRSAAKSNYTTNYIDKSVDYLCEQIGKANAKWWVDLQTGLPKHRNVGELLMLATSELAEALEGDRKRLKDDKLPQYNMFDVEIADCMIRLLDIAFHMIPNFGQILKEKHEYNQIRADHKIENRLQEHGKKY